MTCAEELAKFVVTSSFENLLGQTVNQLKIRVLDALGCAIGALSGQPGKSVRKLECEFGGLPFSTLIGGGKSSPDRAAFYNGALVRYLDFNDSFLSKGETCHPSDNIAPVLAASEYADVSGKEFLVSLAVAYQVQCRLSEVAPLRDRGFDHVTQGAYAVAAGVSKALGLDIAKTANAIAISGTALNALRVTRTGKLSNWKGLAYPFTSFCALHAVFLAREGITGPLEVFEGNKGFMDTVSGRFEIDWSKEKLEAVNQTILKKYNAEIHSQSAIECMLSTRNIDGVKAEDVDSIDVRIFDVAYKIIGGGEEGEKKLVRTKEEADHSLPYVLSVALIDGQVGPEQYMLERISRSDVQTLLRKVQVYPSKEFSKRFPDAMPCEITIHLRSGKTVTRSVDDYEGFLTRPMNLAQATKKFTILTSKLVDENRKKRIIDVVSQLEHIKIRQMTELLDFSLS
ncbi:MAG: MmgE/PrpD family protein [Candidatus Bathyarchaeia archaeon]|jgi:2-methylcitrate dehydratase